MDGGEGQPVGICHPEDDHGNQGHGQQDDLFGRNGKNVADEIFIVFGEAAAAQGGNEDAKGHCRAGENADQGIRCLIGTAADIGK